MLFRSVWNPVFCAGPRLCQFLPGSVCPPSGQHALSGVTPANSGYLGYQSRPLLHLSVLVAVRIFLSCGAAAPLECFTGGVTPMPVSLGMIMRSSRVLIRWRTLSLRTRLNPFIVCIVSVTVSLDVLSSIITYIADLALEDG